MLGNLGTGLQQKLGGVVLSKHLQLLRWAGAKSWLVPRILSDSSTNNRYIEPFLGSGAALLNMHSHMPSFGGDENEELILAMRSVRDESSEVLKHLATFANTRDHYQQIRAQDRKNNFHEMTNSARAARFIYLNHTCFNGLHRVNSRGEFNVPFGNRTLNPEELEARVKSVARTLQAKLEVAGAENLLRTDFMTLLKAVVPGDFVYLDPPYFQGPDSREFVRYTSAGFGAQAHYELLNWMATSASDGIRVLMSNSSTREIIHHSEALGLRTDKVMRHRRMAASTLSRGPVEEVLIANY